MSVLCHCKREGTGPIINQGDNMNYQVQTPHGVFEVIQSLSYGDMIIAGILVIIAVLIAIKVIYDIADREGYI